VVSHPDLKGMIASLAQRDLPGVAGKLGNVLETVTIPAHPAIAEIKKYMIEYGAMASLMSGSGPTVFALVADQREAERIGAALKHHTDAQIVVTETVGVLEGEDGTTVVAN
jgi:4-diphosphocytidyl-2-C-methyl-D-erythritol kinase